MFQVGEKVLYGTAGACTITEICKKSFGDAGEKEYYVLVPIHDGRSTLYVPCVNEALVAKMKKLLSAEEIMTLIDSMPDADLEWISDERKRQEYFKTALKNGDRREIMGIAKSLYNHRKYVLSLGRKLHSCDDKVFREAEKLLCDEFAVVLGMKPSEVMPFIIRRLDERIVK